MSNLIYLFTDDQLVCMLTGTVEMFVEYRDHHGHTEAAALPAAVAETIQGLDAERNLAAEDPEFIVTSQIIPVAVEERFIEPGEE